MDKNKVITSLIYKTIESLSVKGIGFVIGIVLARLLSPDYFGLLALIMVFVNLSQVLVEGGLTDALIQKQDVSDVDFSVVFYLSLGIALINFTVLFLVAPFISSFYNTTELVWPLRVMAFALIVGVYNSVLRTKLVREMKFKTMMYCGLLTTIVSGVIGIITAYLGWGLWALVLYSISSTIVMTIILTIIVKWHPKLVFSIESAKALFSFGYKMLISSFLCSIYSDIRSLLIGKFYSTADLGYYNRGQQYPQLLATTLNGTIQSVMFPVLAKEQDNESLFVSILQRSLSLGAFIIFPVVLFLAGSATAIVTILLTEKWLPCVVFLQILCFGEMTVPLTSMCLVSIKSSGRSDIYMRLELTRRIIMLVILIGSLVFFKSIKAIAIGYSLSAFIDVFIISFSTNKLFGLGICDIIKSTWKTLMSSIIMFFIVYLISLLQINVWLMFFIQILTALIVYLILNTILKNDIFDYLRNNVVCRMKR